MKNTRRSTSSTSDPVTADQITEIKYPIILAPFFGARIPVMVRTLTQAQIMACGNFSLIETFKDKIFRDKAKPKMADIVAYAEIQNEIVKAALMKPTYDELFKLIGSDQQTVNKRQELKALKQKLTLTPRGPQRTTLEEEIDSLRIWCEMILPEDFTASILAYSLEINRSDIKAISEEMLLQAAVLAEKGHDNPSDHLDGRFTAFMKDDINKRAWKALTDRRSEEND